MSKFIKGKSGNPSGRPPSNKPRSLVREVIKFVDPLAQEKKVLRDIAADPSAPTHARVQAARARIQASKPTPPPRGIAPNCVNGHVQADGIITELVAALDDQVKDGTPLPPDIANADALHEPGTTPASDCPICVLESFIPKPLTPTESEATNG
jgi:hypothetical protein